MAVEIEAKMKVPDLEQVRRRLEELSAKERDVHREVNTFFDTEDRELFAADEGLRVRRYRDLSDDAAPEQYRVTWKGPRMPGPIKSRDELEFGVDDGDAVERLLEQLGFVRVLEFEKRRRLYTLDGCEVCLDELPLLGNYVEVEGPDEEAIRRVRDKLGLGEVPILTTSYVAMLMSYLRDHQMSDRRIRFG